MEDFDNNDSADRWEIDMREESAGGVLAGWVLLAGVVAIIVTVWAAA
jgi:hypothetical protein